MNEVKQLNIKDAETVELAHELARLTGESLTSTVRTALREKFERTERALTRDEKIAGIMEIVRRYRALPDRDTRTPEEIIGYDENGLPT